MPMAAPASYWNAAYRSRLAPPLIPHRDDVDNVRKALARCAGLHMLLGVTPEYGELTENMVAVDRRAGVISDLWVPSFPGRDAVRATWLQLPFRGQSFTAIVGDGCLNTLDGPMLYERMFGQLVRILKPGGRLALRTFVTPAQAENCELVCAQAMAAKIGSFHAFKWRFAMAMAARQGGARVHVADIRARFNDLIPDRDELAIAAGWTSAAIETIDIYRDSQIQISFPTLDDVRLSFSPYFREVDLMYGSYELAERCPILVLEAGR